MECKTRFRPARYGFDRAGLSPAGPHRKVSLAHVDSPFPRLILARQHRSQQFQGLRGFRGASLDSSADSKLLYVAEAALADSRVATAEGLYLALRGRNEVDSALSQRMTEMTWLKGKREYAALDFQRLASRRHDPDAILPPPPAHPIC